MAKLHRMSGDEASKVFQRLGFHVDRQKGSHVVLRRGDCGCVIPLHKELAIGTLRSAIRQAGITILVVFRLRKYIRLLFWIKTGKSQASLPWKTYRKNWS